MGIKEFTKSHSTRVIDYVGKALQLDIYYFLKGGFWLGGGFVISSLLALLIATAFARFAPKELYGQYQFVLAFIGIFSAFTLPGMNTAVIQSVSRGLERSIIQATRIRLKWSLLGSLSLLVVAGYLKFIRPTTIWPTFILASVLFPLFYSFDGYGSFYVGKKAFDKAAMYDLTVRLLSTIVLLLTLFFVKDLFWLVFGYMLAIAGTHILFYIWLVSKPLQKSDSEIGHYGLHLSFIDAIMTATAYADKLIVSYFLGFEQLAIYSIATALPEGAKGVMKTLIPLVLPKFAEQRLTYSKIRNKLLLGIMISAGMCIFGIFIAPLLVPLLFTSKYTVSVFFSQILFASLIFGVLSIVLTSFLQARKATRALYSFNLLYALLDIGLLLLLTPRFGVLGACTARLLTRYLSTVQLWILARRL